MIFEEAKANDIRCAGPLGCGRLARELVGYIDGPASIPRFCIGAGCAAWRWTWKGRLPDGSAYRHPDLSGKFPPPLKKMTHGYCGLAGEDAMR